MHVTTIQVPTVLTVPQAAEISGVCATTVRRWIRAKRLPAIDVRRGGTDKRGARYRIMAGALMAFLDAGP
jgi:excisionase family DNA binding protein